MSENVVTINPEKLGKTIRSYIETLVYEDEIPEVVDMAITLLIEAAQQSVHPTRASAPEVEQSSDNVIPF